MRALVLYESMFGDAQRVAEAIGRGFAGVLGHDNVVEVLEIGTAPTSWESGVDLLVVGSPTHAFSLPRESTRADAMHQTGRAVISSGRGLREWLELAHLPVGQPVAVFDTRMDHPKALVRFDRASNQAERALAGLGAYRVAPAQHFRVVDTVGPLVDGEAERATEWGAHLARVMRER